MTFLLKKSQSEWLYKKSLSSAIYHVNILRSVNTEGYKVENNDGLLFDDLKTKGFGANNIATFSNHLWVVFI